MTTAARVEVCDELVEHVAVYAAERGDTGLEDLCDDVLAGDSDRCLVLDIIRNEHALQEWCERRPMRARTRS